MSRRRRPGLLAATTLVAVTAIATGLFVAAAPAAPGTVGKSRTVNPNDIVSCNGQTTVKVALDATTGTAGTSTDVVLALDQSSSVSSSLTTIKNVAKGIVDGIDLTHNRVGVVTFGPTARVLQAPANATDGGAAVKGLIDSIPVTPPGTSGTNHADGFLKAQGAFSPSSPPPHVIVMITDGKTTAGNTPGVNDVTEANTAAGNAKTAGTTIFTVRVGSSTSLDARISGWATDAAKFFKASPNPSASIVTAIGPEVVTPAATHVVVVDTVNPDFTPSNISNAGSFSDGKITWGPFDALTTDLDLTYTATSTVTVQSVKTKQVSSSVTYTSDQDGTVMLSNPDVSVRPCGDIVAPPQQCETGGSCGVNTDPTKLENTGFATLGVDAGPPTAPTTVYLTKLASVPSDVCGGKFTNKFVQADVLPLTDKLVVTVDVPAPTSGPPVGLAEICLGTNLPFVTKNLTLAKQASDGSYYGILPYGPFWTYIAGKGLVRSPSIVLRDSRNIVTVRGSQRVTHIVFEVRAVGVTGSDGQQGYDPKWGG